ncbi:prepilin-type N-terminal cleavage/methylation domain-containing protein [Mycoplasmatota bacterium]|nr:prepilin-type N-terminal cleavage/methylation domain-containing protein [Mycoplasmatota bacterium]
MKIFKNKKGVTIAEMMAVVVIMGIIAAIAIPTVTGMINKTKIKAMEGDAVAVYNAAQTYCIQEDCGTTNFAVADMPDYLNKDFTEYTSVTITPQGSSGKITKVVIVTTADGTLTYDGVDHTWVAPSA